MLLSRSSSWARACGGAAFALLAPSVTQAAPCCTGNSAAPALISGDERAQLGLAVAEANQVGDAPNSGPAVFRSQDEAEWTRTYRLDGALLTGDRSQVGATVPFVDHRIREGSETDQGSSFGDLKFTGAYEILPEWSYSAWKPRGYLYAQVTVPTGRSIYEETRGDLSQTTGRGFWSIALGAALTKMHRNFDFIGLPEVHRSLPRSFAQVDGSRVFVREGFGGSLLLGFGYHLGDFRVGLRWQPILSEGRDVTFVASGTRARGHTQSAVDTGIDLTYSLDENRSVVASYTDETLFGPARNVSLSRSAAIQFLQRWER